jgi:hypothetical protein
VWRQDNIDCRPHVAEPESDGASERGRRRVSITEAVDQRYVESSQVATNAVPAWHRACMMFFHPTLARDGAVDGVYQSAVHPSGEVMIMSHASTGDLTLSVRLLDAPSLWCWQIVETVSGLLVETSWSTEWMAYDSADEAMAAGQRRLAALVGGQPADR